MAVVKELDFWDFKREFERWGVEHFFTEEALKLLYDYLLRWSEEMSHPMVISAVALCEDFTEYSDIEEYNREHDETFNTPEELGYYHNVIGVLDNGGFVVVAH